MLGSHLAGEPSAGAYVFALRGRSANFDLSPPGWTLSTAVCLTAIDDDLAVHESSRHSRGFSFSACQSGFSSTFLVSFVPTPL